MGLRFWFTVPGVLRVSGFGGFGRFFRNMMRASVALMPLLLFL